MKINLQEWFEDRCRNKPSPAHEQVTRFRLVDIFMNEVVFPNGEWQYGGKYRPQNYRGPSIWAQPIFDRKNLRDTDFSWWIFAHSPPPPQFQGIKLKGGVSGKRRVRTVKPNKDGIIDTEKVKEKLDELIDLSADLLEERKEERKETKERMILSSDLYQDSLKGLDPGCSIDTKVNGKCNIFLKNITDEQALEVLEVAAKWEKTHDRRGRKLRKK